MSIEFFKKLVISTTYTRTGPNSQATFRPLLRVCSCILRRLVPAFDCPSDDQDAQREYVRQLPSICEDRTPEKTNKHAYKAEQQKKTGCPVR